MDPVTTGDSQGCCKPCHRQSFDTEETAYYGVYPVIPENTEILGIDIRNGTAVIDFSRHLLNYGTAWSERNIIAAIVYTLTEFETVDDVRILINGYSPGVLKYGTDLSDVVGRRPDDKCRTVVVSVG